MIGSCQEEKGQAELSVPLVGDGWGAAEGRAPLLSLSAVVNAGEQRGQTSMCCIGPEGPSQKIKFGKPASPETGLLEHPVRKDLRPIPQKPGLAGSCFASATNIFPAAPAPSAMAAGADGCGAPRFTVAAYAPERAGRCGPRRADSRPVCGPPPGWPDCGCRAAVRAREPCPAWHSSVGPSLPFHQHPLQMVVALFGNGPAGFAAGGAVLCAAQTAIADGLAAGAEALRLAGLQRPAQGSDDAHAFDAGQQLHPSPQ